MRVDPKIQLLAIYYNGLNESHKQQLLDYSHKLTERQRAQQRAQQRAEQRAEQCADDDGMSLPA